MAESLASFSITATLTAILRNAIDGQTAGAASSQGSSKTLSNEFTSGDGANKANGIWTDAARSISSGNSEDIDVYDLGAIDVGAGAGKDALGQARAHAKIVGLMIIVAATSAGNLLVGGKGTGAAWNSLFNGDDDAKILLGPGGVLFAVNPGADAWAVADTTNHLLTMAASGGDVSYTITLLTRE